MQSSAPPLAINFEPMKPGFANSFETLSIFTAVNTDKSTPPDLLYYHSLPLLSKKAKRPITRFPKSILILLENLLRQEDGDVVVAADIEALLNWKPQAKSETEIQFMPARVLLQDFTGVPVLADLAAMRAELAARGGDPKRINPLQPVDLIIDHSVQVDAYGNKDAMATNSRLEFERNRERYEFLKWGQKAFDKFQVVPPSTGICHQINLEYLSTVVSWSPRNGQGHWLHPDTLVGTDSHTPMINGLGILGWGVGGIEAEAAMLGQPCTMLIPEVVGISISGSLRAGVTATDLVLTITEILRKKGVVGKFIEFTGSGVLSLSVADRATISNMAPEYGATVAYWPVDQQTIRYLKLTGRTLRASYVEKYCRNQGLWSDSSQLDSQQDRIEFSDIVHLDLKTIEPSLSGPSKPQSRHSLSQVRTSFTQFYSELHRKASANSATLEPEKHKQDQEQRKEFILKDGSVVIAAITSCTNTSNPNLMIGAGLIARNAAQRGLTVKPWVKTSFAPGSTAVTGYLAEAGLTSELEKLGFYLVGYGCTTCIGNSGPFNNDITQSIESRDLTVCAVLSGNRNFEARIHPLVRANYLGSPPLVVAYALAGRIDIDFETEPLGQDAVTGQPVYLRDLWPNQEEIEALVKKHVTQEQFQASYADVYVGDQSWQLTPVRGEEIYRWDPTSTYIQCPPLLQLSTRGFVNSKEPSRILGIFGDFITTDHISPAGTIALDSPAAEYLRQNHISNKDFNSYGSRRGNHEVMIRGTFANIRLRNHMVKREGGYTKYWPDGREMTIFDAALKYAAEKTSLVIIAGREYGSGSSRDWAAKGTRLLGVNAVIAQSFERIHRSNLVGMGVLPLEVSPDATANELSLYKSLDGQELVEFQDLSTLGPRAIIKTRFLRPNGTHFEMNLVVRIDTGNEMRFYESGGILPYVLNRLS
jgi:aconitate hydratase